MSATAKPPRVDVLENRREREFMRYKEAIFGLKGWGESEHHAVSSGDKTLTAFAQLLALRLNAKRALISLYDKGQQYMLTEATRTLSLQEDGVSEPGDEILFGTTILPHRGGLNSQALYPKEQPPEYCIDGVAVVFSDLHQHERFSQHSHVLGKPFIRAYAGVPLLAPSGSPVGTLSIADDKTRPQGLSHLEVKYMQDVATSIMSHLELMRTKAIYERGLKMIQGLSRFMDGEAAVDDAPMQQNHPEGGSAESHRNVNGVELLVNDEPAAESSTVEGKDHIPSRLRILRRSSSQRPLSPARKLSDGSAGGTAYARGHSESRMPASKQGTMAEFFDAVRIAQEGLVSPEVSRVFDRAARIIQDSMDMAGVLFLGASSGALGSIHGSATQGSGTDDGASTTAGSDDGPTALKPVEPDNRLCTYLAAAFESTTGDLPPFVRNGISETFLKSLMRRFPFGKIWNFSDDELLSSDEHSDATLAERDDDTLTRTVSTPAKRKRVRSDHEKILEMFPAVRSFGIVPMWDSQRQRFSAGAIVWSYNTSRMFSMKDDVNYLAAFCDVVMTKISKMAVQADARAKTTFISSITHELRSPLHGILGAVECLQESLDASTQGQMVGMIDTCGRSLLDIISNLIDRAQTKPEQGMRTDRAKRRKRRGYRPTPPTSTADLAILTQEVMDSALWLRPEPAPPSTDTKAHTNVSPSDEPLKVMLDIDASNLNADSGWNFHVNPGAWRRIVQNLVSNSIKYTDRGGYCKVTLAVSRPSISDERPTSIAYLTCSDSGRGMSKEYLEHGLWQEFEQEESNVQGTGLGLSLVRNLVEEMAGSIDVQSTKWRGTTIKVSVPLVHGPPSVQQPVASGEEHHLEELMFDLVGFEPDLGATNRAVEACMKFRASLLSLCAEMGMNCVNSETGNVDLCVLAEREAARGGENKHRRKSRHYIIVCDSVKASRAFASDRPEWLARAIVIAQPLGPQKLRKAIASALERPPNIDSGIDTRAPSEIAQAPTPLLDITKPSLASIIKRREHTASPPAVLLTDDKLTSPPAILLVDDNPVNLALLQRSIDKTGGGHVSATNGLEALEAYQNSFDSRPGARPSALASGSPKPSAATISIIFMDITMPVMDGLESTRRIRAFERAMKLTPAKIAALTALASPQARQEAYSSGIDLFLTKPVRFREIQEILATWSA